MKTRIRKKLTGLILVLFFSTSFYSCELIEDIFQGLGNVTLGNCLIDDIVYPNGTTERFEYDSDKKIQRSRTINTSSGVIIITSVYTYNAQKQLARVNHYYGDATSGTPYGYELFTNYTNSSVLGKPQDIRVVIGSSITDYACTYNAQGRMETRTNGGKRVRFVYNTNGQLTRIYQRFAPTEAETLITEHSNYDTKKNPFITIEFLPFLFENFPYMEGSSVFSMTTFDGLNNPRRSTRLSDGEYGIYTYAYNSKDFPTTISIETFTAEGKIRTTRNWTIHYQCN